MALEYTCWLLQHVLLQGYMYVTAKHIAFYAYLPKKANEVAKSGYLSKSGKRNPKYNRYWFRLKGDVLSYYRDSQNLYFPSGQIDLRYGISASITDKEKDGLNFSLVAHHRTYHFRADSAPSAKEWVKSLQRVIFRSHNDGDSVKISLPIENVIDIEETQMLEFADTCKIRVIDNDETYAIDEVSCSVPIIQPLCWHHALIFFPTVLLLVLQPGQGGAQRPQDPGRGLGRDSRRHESPRRAQAIWSRRKLHWWVLEQVFHEWHPRPTSFGHVKAPTQQIVGQRQGYSSTTVADVQRAEPSCQWRFHAEQLRRVQAVWSTQS